MNRALGKKLGVVEDPRTFKLSTFLPEFPSTPPKSELSRGKPWPLYANDHFGDCTFVTHGHRVIAQERNAGQREVTLNDETIIDAYFRHTGGRDEGAYMLDVANEMRHLGLGVEKDGTPHMVEAFVKIDHTNHQEVKTACYLFGGLAFGIWLPEAYQYAGNRWDVVSDDAGGKPGSWGGHSVFQTGYSPEGVVFPSWALRHFMTWHAWDKYVDEAYAFISEDWLNSHQATRSGFKVDQLRGYMKELSQ
jgi:hypothetical protein